MSDPTPPNGDSSRVTGWQLYLAITELDKSIEGRFGDLRVQVQAVSNQVQTVDQAITGKGGLNERMADHEARLRAVEKWKSALPVATLLFAASTAIALIGLFLRS